MKMHLICPAISRLVSAERVMYRAFLCFSRTHLCTRSSEGQCFTATSNCPQATGSHFQAGSFIFRRKRKWSLALSLNHPHATAYKVIKEGPVRAIQRAVYIHKHAVTWTGVRTWEGTSSPPCEAVLRWNWDYGLCYRFVVLSSKRRRGTRADWMLRFAKCCDRGRRWEQNMGEGGRGDGCCAWENWKFLST